METRPTRPLLVTYVLPGLIVKPTPAFACFSNFSVPYYDILHIFRDIPELDRQSSSCIVLEFHISRQTKPGVDPVSVPTLNVVRIC